MFSEAGAPHHVPHFLPGIGIGWLHSASIDKIRSRANSRSGNGGWSRRGPNQAELITDWELLHSGRKPQAIEPLK
jgi:hypothetical protein